MTVTSTPAVGLQPVATDAAWPSSGGVARLAGSSAAPVFEVTLFPDTLHPRLGTAMTSWIAVAPGVVRTGEMTWRVAVGGRRDVVTVLAEAGLTFEVPQADSPQRREQILADITRPQVRVVAPVNGMCSVMIRPRLGALGRVIEATCEATGATTQAVEHSWDVSKGRLDLQIPEPVVDRLLAALTGAPDLRAIIDVDGRATAPVTAPYITPSPLAAPTTASTPAPGSAPTAQVGLGCYAILGGTAIDPHLALVFAKDARHAKTGRSLTEWVKELSGARWDGTYGSGRGAWIVTGLARTIPQTENVRRAGHAVGGWSGSKGGDLREAPCANPDTMLAEAGFSIDFSGVPGTVAIADYVQPYAAISPVDATRARVFPRLTGWHTTRALIGDGSQWVKDPSRAWTYTTGGYFEVPLTDLFDHSSTSQRLLPGLASAPGVAAAAAELLIASPTYGHATHADEAINYAASVVAAANGIDTTDSQQHAIDVLTEVVGEIPAWFGKGVGLDGSPTDMKPRPYQHLGGLAAVAKRGALFDPPGLGKTSQSLLAMALSDSRRGLLVVPPVVLSNWAIEARMWGLDSPGRFAHEADPDAAAKVYQIVTIKPGRKVPPLPEQGIVIVSDSLLPSRPEIVADLEAWSPDAFVYDEAHRARTWSGKRSTVIRDMARRFPAECLRIASTGTPLFSSPIELAALLDLTGHLDRVFGGFRMFVDTYCERDYFNKIVPKVSMLPQLRQILEEQVWIRRDKATVLADLPKVSHGVVTIDVSLTEYRAAHKDLAATLMQWLDDFAERNEGRMPFAEEYEGYARSNVGLLSPLRKAAGIAKIPALTERVGDWIDANVTFNPAEGGAIGGRASGQATKAPAFTVNRPLLVWVHHQEVLQALMRSITDAHGGPDKDPAVAARLVRVIDGATSATRRQEIVEEFQAGIVPVLICSITAAGVGITLTRGSDMLFAETDWSPPNVQQAIDRQNRMGQTLPVSVTTLVAEGTQDAHIHSILQNKADIIATTMGDDSIKVVSTYEEASAQEGATPWKIVAKLIEVLIVDREKKTKKNTSRAA